MSGFTRDTKHYGDRLVYEALRSKWHRYHTHCGCLNNWITHHAEPAGFTVIREGSGFVALTGPGLTDDVDETRLTTNALWVAVTGKPGTQDWYEPVRVIDRSTTADSPARKPAEQGSQTRRRSAKSDPVTAAQVRYLTSLITKTSKDRFDSEFAAAIKGTSIAARGKREKTLTAVKRLTKPAATKLINGLLV